MVPSNLQVVQEEEETIAAKAEIKSSRTELKKADPLSIYKAVGG